MLRRTWLGIVSLALCATLAACGSTVQTGVTAAPDELAQGDQGLGVTATEPGAAMTDSSGAPISGGTGPTSSTGAGGNSSGTAPATGPGGAGAGPAAAPGSSGPAAAPGPSGSGAAPGPAAAAGGPVKVGVTYPNVAALASIFGQENDSDPQAWVEKLIKYINSTGGVAGRDIEPTFFEADTAQDQSTVGQQACAHFTQDNKVDIVVNAGTLGETLPACLAKSGVSMVDTAWFATDGHDMARHPNWLLPVAMRTDRNVGALINVSAQRGLLKQGDTLGVLIEDCPWANRVLANTVQPAAQQLGVKVVTGSHKCIQNLVQDLAPVSNDIQRETLRFNTEGVTHVIVVSLAEAFVVAQFTQNASQQRYYPKYFVSSLAYPFGNSQPDAIVKISDDALPNMTGAGTLPLLDVGPLAKADGPQQKAAQARCKKADPNEGGTKSEEGSGRFFARNTYLSLCDAFYTLKAVLETNGVRYSIGDVAAGFQRALSGRTASATLAGGSFRTAGDRLDGAGLVRPFAWDSERRGFVYTDRAIPVP